MTPISRTHQQTILDGIEADAKNREDSGDGSTVSLITWFIRELLKERMTSEVLARALESCNESRDRLTRFRRPAGAWVTVAIEEFKREDEISRGSK
jgi:ferritin